MAIGGGPALPPIPPSEARDGEMYKLRYLGQEDPKRPVQTGYGNLFVLGVLATVAIVGIGGALYLGLRAQSEVNVTLSRLATSVGPCDTPADPANGSLLVNYSFVLTNSGTRDAYAIVDLYGNGVVLGSTGPISVPAGRAIPDEESATVYACGPVMATAAIRSVSPVP